MIISRRFTILVFMMHLLLPSITFKKSNSIQVVTANSERKQIYNFDNLVSNDFADDSFLVVLNKNNSVVNISPDSKYFSNINVKSIVDLLKRENGKKKNNFRQILKINLTTNSKANVLKAINNINNAKELEGVLFAQPNYIYTLNMVPNDYYYSTGDLWGLNTIQGINAQEAWDITTGKKDIRVGVIDGPIFSHEDFKSNTNYVLFVERMNVKLNKEKVNIFHNFDKLMMKVMAV